MKEKKFKKLIKSIKFLLILLLLFPLTGCWDSVDLEELLIVYGLGIDISENNPDQYMFTIGFPTIIEEAPAKKASFSAEAPSLAYGKGNLQEKVYRQLSYDNIKVVAFSEEVARKGIMPHVDSMLRLPLFRGTTRFAIVDGRAKNLFEIAPPVSLLISDFIYESIQQNHESTTVPITSLRNFSNQYYTIGIEPSIPFISYENVENKLNVGSIALFKGDTMIHKLSGLNSKSFMLLKGEVKQGTFTIEYISEESNQKEFITVNFTAGKSKIKTEIIEDQLYIYQDISILSHLGEHTEHSYIFTKERLQEIERLINTEVKKYLEETLQILQKQLENDNIGYGKYVKANHPDFFDSKDWNRQFAKAIIQVNPRIEVNTIGVTP